MNIKNKPIGILGGMGPDASARLYQMMIDMSRDEFGVRKNHEYPEIVLQSIPVPEFFSNTSKVEEATFMLKDRVKKMCLQPLSCIGMVCNTAHTTLIDLEQVSQMPFISIAKEITKEIVKRGYKRVGLLGSPTTIFSGVYQIELLKEDIEVELPENGDIEKLEKIIGEIIGGEFKKPKKKLLKISDNLKKKKVEAIILGCTELPLVFPKNYSLPVLDSLSILARSLLQCYYQKENI